MSPRLIPVGIRFHRRNLNTVPASSTDLAGEITVAGRGAGRAGDASAVMSDIYAVMKRAQKHGQRD